MTAAYGFKADSGKPSNGLFMSSRLGRGKERGQALLPSRNGVAHLVHVLEPVVDRGHAADAAGGVIEEPLNHVGSNPECGKVRSEGPAEVVECPVRDAARGIERLLLLRPPIERGRGLTSDVGAAWRKEAIAFVGYPL